MNRRLLVAFLAILSLIAMLSGLAGVLIGPTALPGGAPVTPTVDSEFRFTNVFWFSAGVILAWTLFRLDARATITRLVLMIAALGGIARLVSAAVVGWPHPVFVAALVLELVGVPLVVLWHWRVVRPAPSIAP